MGYSAKLFKSKAELEAIDAAGKARKKKCRSSRQSEAQIKRNRVFILGSGFSAAAGVPSTQSLLKQAMQALAAECPELHRLLVRHARKVVAAADGDALDFERVDFTDFCTFLEFIEQKDYGGRGRWGESPCQEKAALRFYLAKTLVGATPVPESVPPLYADFARQLHANDVVLSLNWDGLLENALTAVGKDYSYSFEGDDPIKLCKLHGSVNWRLSEPDVYTTGALDWQSLWLTQDAGRSALYQTPDLLTPPAWGVYRPQGEIDPFLVLPGYGKAFDVRMNAALWYKLEAAFCGTYDVYVIGLSAATGDFFVRSFLLSTLPESDTSPNGDGRRIFVVNPDRDAATDFAFVLSRSHAQWLSEPFGPDHLQLMASRLAETQNP